MRFEIAATLIFLGGLLPVHGDSQENVSTFSLKNGLEVVVIEDHSEPSAVHMIWYRVGAADEPPGKSGIAHLVENLMLHGAKKIDSEEYSRFFTKNDVEANAFVSYDFTSFFHRTAPKKLELMMMLEAGRMQDLNFSRGDFEQVRRRMLEDRDRSIGSNPDRLFAEQRMAALFLNHPYGIPVNGWRHEFENLTEDDALDFFRRHYAPNNAILLVAGDALPEDVRKLAELHYGAIEPALGIGPRRRPAEPPHRAERRLKFKGAHERKPYLVRNYLAPERDSGEQASAAALVVLKELLGGTSSDSVLNQKLVLERMVAMHALAFYGGTAYDDTFFGLFVMPRSGVMLAEAEAALDEALAEFLRDGPDPGRLERAVNRIRAKWADERNSVEAQAMKYGRALMSGLSIGDIREWPGIVESVTGEDIIGAARRVLTIENSVTGWMMAKESE